MRSAVTTNSTHFITLLSLLVSIVAVAQEGHHPLSTEEALARTVQSSVCEVLRGAKQFDGRTVTVHARYSGTWEGFYLSDPSCEQLGEIYLAYPNREPLLPKEYASLSLVTDDGFAKFETISRALCNGLSLLCDYDYLDGDFAGLVMVKDDFKVEDGFGNGFGHLSMSKSQFVMLQVANAKLHAVAEPLLKSSKVVAQIGPDDCATEVVRPNFVLDSPRQVRGTVLDVTGSPFASTRFQIRKYNKGDETIKIKTVTTDKNGNFDAGRIEKGEYRFVAPHRGWKQPVSLSCSESVQCDLRIVLEPNPTDVPYAGCPVK